MFAFAVYDASTQSVFAARDRFGEKPLYVLETESTVYLSSELKALVEAGVVDKRLDPECALRVLHEVLHLRSPHHLSAACAGCRPDIG